MLLSYGKNLFVKNRIGSRKNWSRPVAELLEDRTLLTATSALQHAYGQLPLSFEVNEGQTASQVRFLSHSNGSTLFLTENSAVLSLTQSPQDSTREGQTPAEPSTMNMDPGSRLGGSLALPRSTTGVALSMNLGGANANATVAGLDQQSGITNYFIGNDPSQWHTDIANYGKVEYQNVYAGINLVYYGNQQQLEYDFVVAPGANPNNIQLNFQGAESISLDAKGDLVLHTAIGDVLQHAPVMYQEINGVRQAVPGSFVLGENGNVSFQVGAYDKSLSLTIDPVLSYSTYLGGDDQDEGLGIAVDSAGNAYLTGDSLSTNFPTTAGAFQTSGGGDAIVTKLNASGTALVYSTYLGGSDSLDYGTCITVDASGNAYVSGFTEADDFPTTAGAFQTNPGGGADAFVSKLNMSGTALAYSTYLGGDDNDYEYGGNSIAVDGSGNAYVTGSTFSTNFPTTAGAFQTSHASDFGSADAFVTKLNASGTALVYSTYLGGNSDDEGVGIAVDFSGNAFVTGRTSSTNLPTTAGAFQTSHASDFGSADAFVTKLNASGTALVYSTYLGGNNDDEGLGVALDSSDDAYVTGGTTSSNFPTTAGAFQTSLGGGGDAFVTMLNASGTALVYSTYLGSTGSADAIAVDSSGNAYVTGSTGSTGFPTTAGAFQTTSGGDADAFVTMLNASGTSLLYSTYLGGDASDFGYGIALDGSGNAFITGDTYSSNFPTTAGAFQTGFGGDIDAFVSKFAFGAPTTTSLTDNGPNPSVDGQAVSFTATVSGGSNTDGETITIEDASNGNAVVASPTLTNGTATFTIFNLTVGTHNLFAVYNGDAINGGSDSSASPVTQVVNPAAPAITSVVINQNNSALYNAAGQPFSGAQRSMVNDIVYTFSEPVNILSPADDPTVFTIAVASGWTGTVPTLSWAPVAGSNNTQWAVTFSGNGVTGASIANGAYSITIADPASITAESDGQALSLATSGIGGATQSFYRLFGDINGDEFVNAADNVKFKQALTTYNAAFDYSQDGFVNAADNGKFKNDLTVNFTGFAPTI
jgi:Bacterial Ig-like domain (group 3)/Beta-propeller repeat